MVSVLDYGAGNVNSVIRMVEKVGFSAKKISTRNEVLEAEKLIVPGVGKFDHCITELKNRDLLDALNEVALVKKIDVLGICIGMQMMCKSSEEGELPGLGWFDAEVKKFQECKENNLKVPHMSWSEVRNAGELNKEIPEEEVDRFYFVHSFYVSSNIPEEVLFESKYGHGFVSGLKRDNITGVQFHPEKSHRFGMAFIKQFCEGRREP